MENKQLNETITSNAQNALFQFLSMPLWWSCEIFEIFRSLGGQSQYSVNPRNLKERFLYIEGTRKDKVVLIAHADTYFDEAYGYGRTGHSLIWDDDIISGKDSAIGADDRTGCTILWQLRNSGHSLLITDGEENGLMGSYWLCRNHPGILERTLQIEMQSFKSGHSFFLHISDFFFFRKMFLQACRNNQIDITSGYLWIMTHANY